MSFTFLLLGFIFSVCAQAFMAMHIRNSIASVCMLKRELKKKKPFISQDTSRETVTRFYVTIRTTICLCFLPVGYGYKSATSCGCIIMLEFAPDIL